MDLSRMGLGVLTIMANRMGFEAYGIETEATPDAHRRIQSRSDWEWEKIRYHFYHFKG